MTRPMRRETDTLETPVNTTLQNSLKIIGGVVAVTVAVLVYINDINNLKGEHIPRIETKISTLEQQQKDMRIEQDNKLKDVQAMLLSKIEISQQRSESGLNLAVSEIKASINNLIQENKDLRKDLNDNTVALGSMNGYFTKMVEDKVNPEVRVLSKRNKTSID